MHVVDLISILSPYNIKQMKIIDKHLRLDKTIKAASHAANLLIASKLYMVLGIIIDMISCNKKYHMKENLSNYFLFGIKLNNHSA